MHTRKRYGGAGIALAALSVILSTAAMSGPTMGSAAAAESSDPPSNVVVEPWAPPDAGDAIPADLSDTAARAAGVVDYNPSEYSGSWFDPESRTIVLGAVHPAEAAKGLARRAEADDDVTISDAQFSLEEGQRILETFFAGSPLREKAVMWGLKPDGSGFEISMIGEPTKGDLAALAKLPGRVHLQTGLSQKAEVTDALSDTSPFAGGMRYFMVDFVAPLPDPVVQGGRCTAGFPYVENGTQFILTAGHCWAQGQRYDEMWRATGSNANPTMVARIGQFNGRTSVGAPTTGSIQVGGGYHGDLALINISAEGKAVGDSIWTSNTNKRYVTSRQAPAVQDRVCRSGTSSWQVCDLQVTNTNTSWNTVDGGTIRQGDLAYIAGEPCSVAGDSGGPVYQRIGENNAIAIGIISGRIAAPGGCFLTFTGVEEAIQAWGGGPKLH